MRAEHRVIGPPGTGKTTYLTRQVKLAASKYGAGRVIVASLTRTAAAEVASRDSGIPPQNIGTMHAHAFRRLGRPPMAETSKGIKSWNEATMRKAWRLSNKMVADPENALIDGEAWQDDGDALLSTANVLRARMTPVVMWPASVLGFFHAWCEWKRDHGYWDFSDLIERAIEREVGLDGDVLFLDEAQDMSRLEMTLARMWGEDADQLVIVGDPDQNLYEWRGSDPEAFYADDVVSEHVLEQSWRVPGSVHARAVGWIEGMPGRRPVAYKPRDEDGAVHIHRTLHFNDPHRLLGLVEERAECGTVMVLGSCGYMLAPLVQTMRARGVPFHNPYRTTHGGWNPMASVNRLLAFLRPSKAVWGEQARLWTWGDMKKWTEPMQAKGALKHGMKSLIESKAMQGRFDSEEDQRLMRIADVLDVFEDASFEPVMDMDIDWWLEHLKHNDRKRQEYAVKVVHTRGVDALRTKPKIIVGTIHSVKGGEADSVILMPDLSHAAYYEAWKAAASNPRGHAAIYRLMYVGMTRARHELHLIGPAGVQAANIHG